MGLLLSLIKNYGSFKMNDSLTGYEILSDECVLKKEDLINYAAATGDSIALYEKDNATAPPFYASRLVFPLIKKIITHPRLKMNLLRMVHAEQEIIWRRSLTVDDTVAVKVRVNEIYTVSAGEMIQVAGFILADGEPSIEATMGFLVRNKNRGPSKKIEQNSNRDELFRCIFATREDQQLEYARASGDTNFIHTNNLVARLAGLPGTIMHGICIMAMTANCLRDELVEGDAGRMKRMKCRFSRPALPGQKLTVAGYNSGKKGLVYFEVLNEKGGKVIKDGGFEYIP